MIIATHNNNRFAPTGIWLEAHTREGIAQELDDLQVNSGASVSPLDLLFFDLSNLRDMPPEEYALIATRWVDAKDYGFPSEDASDLISQEIARRTWAA